MITKDSLKEDFRNLGIKEGDTLFLRISYKAVGKIEGGPMVFLEALHEVIGEEGTIILTAFPKKYIRQLRFFHKKEVYSYENPPKPTTGVMSIMAMSYPGARISRKLEFPFVVIGKHAKYLTNSHTHDKRGYWLLEEAINKFNCKCLRIGGEGFTGTTHIAFTKVLEETGNYQVKPKHGLYLKEGNNTVWYDAENTIFCHTAFLEANAKYIYPSIIQKIEGSVGNGHAVLTSMLETLKKEEEFIRKDITKMLCHNTDCLLCRVSFSFSDSNYIAYFSKQLARICKGDDIRESVCNIRNLFSNMFFGVKQR